MATASTAASDTAASHGKPLPEAECMVCMDDLEADTYFEYKSCEKDGGWLPAQMCTTCLQSLLDTQYTAYTKRLAAPSCAAELRRLLKTGPPERVMEKYAMPCPLHKDDKSMDCPVTALWLAKDNAEISPILKGALTGQERLDWWEEQKKFHVDDFAEEDAAADGAAAADTATATTTASSASASTS